jgi:hypothetical protein
MFLQVIQGRVPDRTAMRAQHDAWVTEIGATEPGWIGSTAGITEDDRFICLSAFNTREAFARVVGRPDAQEWWARSERLFLGQVVTSEYLDVVQVLDGPAQDAGFVQVAQGRAADAGRLAALQKELLRVLPDGRPDIVGGLGAVSPDGRFVQLLSFSTEELARAGEHGAQLPEVEEVIYELRELTGEPTYHDLRHPWHGAARPAGERRAANNRRSTQDGERPGRVAAVSGRARAGAQPWTPPTGGRRPADRRP